MGTNFLSTISSILPSVNGCSLTYLPNANMYVSQGYTSVAGNSYFRGLRVSDRLAIIYEIGQGWYHTFINGITIYAFNGNKANIIGKAEWGGCNNWHCFSENFIKEKSIRMVKDYLCSQLKIAGNSYSERDVENFANQLIGDTMVNKYIEKRA